MAANVNTISELNRQKSSIVEIRMLLWKTHEEQEYEEIGAGNTEKNSDSSVKCKFDALSNERLRLNVNTRGGTSRSSCELDLFKDQKVAVTVLYKSSAALATFLRCVTAQYFSALFSIAKVFIFSYRSRYKRKKIKKISSLFLLTFVGNQMTRKDFSLTLKRKLREAWTVRRVIHSLESSLS
jgi:hypothetical protein